MAWEWFRKLAVNPTARMVAGERGEDIAARHLRRQGYKVLVRRFNTQWGEIDIVARHGEVLVFVEVKTRKSEEFGAPSEAVTREKQRHMSKAALEYLRMLGNPQIYFRFDIVEVILPAGAREATTVRIIPNAFDLSEPHIY